MKKSLCVGLVIGLFGVSGSGWASSHSESPRGHTYGKTVGPSASVQAQQVATPTQLSAEIKASLERLLAPVPAEKPAPRK